ncbi:hypothetical protein BO71DRAFT_109616 [Aspergillus ellipticus CBS 707.79]|uniref:Uncharacterized protein n=1 Tax=Aspergillus ellipticus CBS 707.79 TaxID=1448320 RepID=A0A319CXU9_9EURO|nr:hypothetical protein BO71DRAFT_109616 [Aspergillus ellipticus CBS 707.79]
MPILITASAESPVGAREGLAGASPDDDDQAPTPSPRAVRQSGPAPRGRMTTPRLREAQHPPKPCFSCPLSPSGHPGRWRARLAWRPAPRGESPSRPGRRWLAGGPRSPPAAAQSIAAVIFKTTLALGEWTRAGIQIPQFFK